MPLPQVTGTSPDVAPPPLPGYCPPGTTRVGAACLPTVGGVAPGPKPSAVGYTAPEEPEIRIMRHEPDTPAGVTRTDDGREVLSPPFPWGGLIIGLAAVFLLRR